LNWARRCRKPGLPRLFVAPSALPPYLYPMAKESDRFDPQERAREKQLSRDADAHALASGEKSRDELRRENGHFAFRNVRVTLRGAKPLE
jgi:hypothetical protein